jgi:quercetin dioxygenase-like cupin family protein
LKIFRFDTAVGRKLEQFGSINAMLSGVVRLTSEAQVSCIYLAPDGMVGYHQAATSQLFMVVQGEGWVRGESPDRSSIASGRAAFWERSEWHESGTEKR